MKLTGGDEDLDDSKGIAAAMGGMQMVVDALLFVLRQAKPIADVALLELDGNFVDNLHADGKAVTVRHDKRHLVVVAVREAVRAMAFSRYAASRPEPDDVYGDGNDECQQHPASDDECRIPQVATGQHQYDDRHDDIEPPRQKHLRLNI